MAGSVTPVSWYNPVDKVVIGTYLLKEMEEKMMKIKHNLKATQDRQKSYADKNNFFRVFKVVKHVSSK